ncbi:MAG: hypothetical protein U1F87_11920 [Kiritimatiellia bacterium]
MAWHAAMAALEEREGGPAAALPHWERRRAAPCWTFPARRRLAQRSCRRAHAALARLRERAGSSPLPAPAAFRRE